MDRRRFIDLYFNGLAKIEDIDKFEERWDKEKNIGERLWDYLGLTNKEYLDWYCGRYKELKKSLDDRRKNRKKPDWAKRTRLEKTRATNKAKKNRVERLKQKQRTIDRLKDKIRKLMKRIEENEKYVILHKDLAEILEEEENSSNEEQK